MQIFFTNEVDDYEKHQPTAGTQGYANNAEQIQEVVHQELTNIFNSNAKIFGNLQMAEEEELAMQPPNDSPTDTANAMTAAEVLTEICTMLTSYAKTSGRHTTQNQQGTGTNDRSTRRGRNPPLPAQGLDDEGIPITYCWSHEMTRNLNHTSATCNRKKEGNQDNTTLQNKMGGCTGGCAPRGA